MKFKQCKKTSQHNNIHTIKKEYEVTILETIENYIIYKNINTNILYWSNIFFLLKKINFNAGNGVNSFPQGAWHLLGECLPILASAPLEFYFP